MCLGMRCSGHVRGGGVYVGDGHYGGSLQGGGFCFQISVLRGTFISVIVQNLNDIGNPRPRYSDLTYGIQPQSAILDFRGTHTWTIPQIA